MKVDCSQRNPIFVCTAAACAVMEGKYIEDMYRYAEIESIEHKGMLILYS